MPHVERNIEIEASAKKVFDILDDISLANKWNLVTKEVTELEPGKTSIKSTVGDMITTRIENVPHERISASIEGGLMSAIGYVLKQRGDVTDVTLWADFDDEKKEKILVKAGELLLKGLKNFVEYVESGGNIDEYDKKQILTIP